ncbi:hypothetical protein GCM10022221_74450 [Actinocorallia aurea]
MKGDPVRNLPPLPPHPLLHEPPTRTPTAQEGQGWERPVGADRADVACEAAACGGRGGWGW